MCGLFGITHNEQAIEITHLGLFALQHRGQESAGIAATNEKSVTTHSGSGLVSDVLKENNLITLKQSLPIQNENRHLHSIGHVRYATAGGRHEENIQPLFAQVKHTPVALAHNGNIVNADALRFELQSTGALLRGTADTELILHLLARENGDFEKNIERVAAKLVGAFSLLILTPTHLYALVDAYGYRPLSLASLGTSWVLASESCAFDLVGAKRLRDVEPGELVTIDLKTNQLSSRRFAEIGGLKRCAFESIYFARPDSKLWSQTVEHTRFALGYQLGKESKVDADFVMAVPDSGVPMAMGFAEATGLPLRQGFIRNHYVGRTFIEPTSENRFFRVRLKLNPIEATIRNKKIVVIDDSVVRGTTARTVLDLLRELGAKQLHLRVGSPPIKFPCYFGIDTPQKKDLISQRMNVSKLQDYLKLDSLAFLSEHGLGAVLGKLDTCTSCFTGRYNDALSQQLGNPPQKAQTEGLQL